MCLCMGGGPPSRAPIFGVGPCEHSRGANAVGPHKVNKPASPCRRWHDWEGGEGGGRTSSGFREPKNVIGRNTEEAQEKPGGSPQTKKRGIAQGRDGLGNTNWGPDLMRKKIKLLRPSKT